jgi:hypothetical protein
VQVILYFWGTHDSERWLKERNRMSGEQKIWGKEAHRLGGDLQTPPLGSLGQSGGVKIFFIIFGAFLFFSFFCFYFFFFRPSSSNTLPVPFRIHRQVARSQGVYLKVSGVNNSDYTTLHRIIFSAFWACVNYLF